MMKKFACLLFVLMLMTGISLHAQPPEYYSPVTRTGADTGMNMARLALPAAAIAAFIAVVATNSDGASSHSHN